MRVSVTDDGSGITPPASNSPLLPSCRLCGGFRFRFFRGPLPLDLPRRTVREAVEILFAPHLVHVAPSERLVAQPLAGNRRSLRLHERVIADTEAGAAGVLGQGRSQAIDHAGDVAGDAGGQQ